MKAQFPPKLQFLFEPAKVGQPGRYKVLEGGRGGGKSENIAQALLILGTQEPCLILCTREIQRAIRDSVHAMLKQWIVKLGLGDGGNKGDGNFYDVTDVSIKGRNGTEFIFWGLSNIDSLKSIAQVRYCWVEEAQVVSKSSWEKLIPSIRWEDKKAGIVSEIWVSYNPELDTDDTYRRFHLDPPKTARVEVVNWRDNPWFPEVLRVEMEELREKNYDDYLHVWEGKTKQTVEGAIFGKEVIAAANEGRITKVPYNRARPVDTIWDLGQDMTSVWFVQNYSGYYNFIDFYEADRIEIADHLMVVQARQYVYGKHWIPYDGLDTIIHKKTAGLLKRHMSIRRIMTEAGLRVEMVDKVEISERINAGRTIFPQCRFDEEKCADGLQALRHYQWGPLNKIGERKRDPIHNWASHASESFTRAGQVGENLCQVKKKPDKPDDSLSGYEYSDFGYAPFG